MSLDLSSIKEKIESVFNLAAGTFGMCCGNITLLQCSNAAGMIANIGGAAIVMIQLRRMMKKKE